MPAGDKYAAVKRDGEALLKKLKAWDEDMVQRRSKAYDDVENFANKFTANYMFLVNQTESDIPRVNQSTLDRLEVLGAEWSALNTRSNDILSRGHPVPEQEAVGRWLRRYLEGLTAIVRPSRKD